ncbi:MAG: topoisomerase II large subunit [Enterobacter phage ENC7]|nr:MAG: topoisomerase II large subunit [Enterobacter phage ENC7]UIW11919.1 MAG: topoisomerase II large subunit [Enterobacter phage ENC25]UIW12177.1 MAG: topoisomerase II large subunit [Enterobacter phage ENC22]
MSLDFLLDEDEPQKAPEAPTKGAQVDESFCLSDRDHIRKRPNMYVGSVNKEAHERFIMGKFRKVEYVEGLVKIINEILDNSIDEAIRTDFKHANKIDVKIDRNLVTISDNGRGIPQDDVRTPEGKIVPKPVAAWTMAKSGSNFDDENRVTMGMNGVGSFLTNCYSSIFIGETSNGKRKVTINCTDGAQNMDYRTSPTKEQGTTVKFTPDFSIFGVDGIDEETKEVIKDRLMALAVAFPAVRFTYNGETLANKFALYAGMYGEHTIIQASTKVSFILASTEDGFKQKSFVNGLDTKNGGVHVDSMIDGIYAELEPMIKKKHAIEIPKARVKECLTLVVFLHNFNAPAFDSQTKEKLTNTAGEFNNHAGLNYKKIAKQIMDTSEIITPIIESALIRKQAAEAAAITKAKKKAKKAKVAKHVPASGIDTDGVETTLFLTEGDSAVGQFIECRNEETQGAFPLRGKPLNTWGMSNSDILKNKELFELMAILNLHPGDSSEMTYDNIGIMVDADVDGGDILTLLIAFFSRWPELFEKKKIRYIRTPIIIAKIGREEKWFYSLDEFTPFRDKAKEVRYIKGLGSLRKEDYDRVLGDHLKYDTIVLGDEHKDVLELCFGDDSDPRKDWVNGKHKFSVK